MYQHLGNLSPAELADNEDFQRLVATEGDTWPHLAELAERADREVDCNKGIRFSYRWDLGRSRLIMVDSRNGRILESGERMMIGDNEFRWLEAKAEEDPESLDHLMLGLIGAVVDASCHRRSGDAQRASGRASTGGAANWVKSCARQAISNTGRRSTNPSCGWAR